MEISMLDISEYEAFEKYLVNIRHPDYPYDKFVALTLHLPRFVAVDFLLRATHRDDINVLCEAVDLLSRVSASDALPRCLELLHHPDKDVRRVAVECLNFFQAPCEDEIIHRLQDETDGDVRSACVRLLSNVGTSGALATLEQMRHSDTSKDYEGRSIRPLAEAAMGKILSRSK